MDLEQSHSDINAPPFALGRNILALVGLILGAALAVSVVLPLLGAQDQLVAALGGASVGLIAGIVALLPLHWAKRRSRALAPMLAIVGSGLRVVITLLGAVVLIAAVDLAMPVAAVWVLGWYLLVMVFEVMLIVRYFRSLSPSASGEGDR